MCTPTACPLKALPESWPLTVETEHHKQIRLPTSNVRTTLSSLPFRHSNHLTPLHMNHTVSIAWAVILASAVYVNIVIVSLRPRPSLSRLPAYHHHLRLLQSHCDRSKSDIVARKARIRRVATVACRASALREQLIALPLTLITDLSRICDHRPTQHMAQRDDGGVHQVVTYIGRRWIRDDSWLSAMSSYKLCGVRTESGSWALGHDNESSLNPRDLEESVPSVLLLFPDLCTFLLSPHDRSPSASWRESNSQWTHAFREMNGELVMRGILYLNIDRRVVAVPMWRNWLQWIGLAGVTHHYVIKIVMSCTELVPRSGQRGLDVEEERNCDANAEETTKDGTASDTVSGAVPQLS